MGKTFIFDDLGLKRIYTNSDYNPCEKKISAQKMFLYQNDKVSKCAFDYIAKEGQKAEYSRLINLAENN